MTNMAECLVHGPDWASLSGGAARHCRAAGIGLRLVASRPVRRLVEATGLVEYLDLELA
jgi:hypothetical protein